MRRKIIALTFCTTIITIFIGSIYNNAHTNSSGAPNGHTGSPGDGGNTCAVSGCHSGISVGTKSNVFTSNIPSDGYIPGNTYTITATVRSSPSRNTFGFQISPQTNSGSIVGTLISTSASTKITGAGKYLTHTSSGITGTNGVKSWSFNWTAPTAGTGNVTFYGAFNHANGNGGTSGDSIFKSTFIAKEKIAAPIVNLGGPTGIICNGSSKVLDAGNPGSTYLWTKDNVQISTTRTVTATQAGKYKVIVTNSGGVSASDSIQLSVAAPFTLNLADRNLCVGSTITLDAGNVGTSYLWSTGATTQTINVSGPGAYSVKVTNSVGCEARDTIIVTSVPSPVINLGGNISVCAGTTITLDAGNAGASYLWNTGATTQTIQVNTAGFYFVTVTQNSCSASDSLQVIYNALPIVNLGNDLDICLSDTVVLDAGNIGSTYLWSTGDTTQTIKVNAAGTYAVSVTNANACVSSDEIIVTNKALPNASFTAQATLGLTVQFEANQQANYTYFWDFDDPNSASNSSTLANPLHEFSAKGTYIVKLTVTDGISGCKNTVLDTIEVVSIGLAEINKHNPQNLKVSPNPFIGNTNITFTLSAAAENVSLEVYNELGRKVATLINGIPHQAGKHKIEYQNNNHLNPSGNYILRLTVDGKSSILKMVKTN
jgi:PKD domain/Reeler domain